MIEIRICHYKVPDLNLDIIGFRFWLLVPDLTLDIMEFLVGLSTFALFLPVGFWVKISLRAAGFNIMKFSDN